MDNQDQFNKAIEYKRNGDFKKAIEIYESLLKNAPLDLGLYSALGKVCYLNKQFEKAVLNYFLSFHLRASGNFPHYSLPLEEFKSIIIADCFNITYHAGNAILAIDLNHWKQKLSRDFDVEVNVNNYSKSIMGKVSNIDPNYHAFTQHLGGVAFLNYIQWNKLNIRSLADLINVTNDYKSICEMKESFAA